MFQRQVQLLSKRSARAASSSATFKRVLGQRESDEVTTQQTAGQQQRSHRHKSEPEIRHKLFSGAKVDDRHITRRQESIARKRREASLADELFSDSWFSFEAHGAAPKPQADREVPRLSLDVLDEKSRHGNTAEEPIDHVTQDTHAQQGAHPAAATRTERHRGESLQSDGHTRRTSKDYRAGQATSRTAVLRVEKASTNLTIADFRRLIPQGKHIEGWVLESEDITRVVPHLLIRDLRQVQAYYLYFSSEASARAYREHVLKIYSMMQHFAPKPPFWQPAVDVMVIDGIPVASSIAALQAVTGHQRPSIEHLSAKLMPAEAAYVENGGLLKYLTHPNKMPFELRLELEGPQVSLGPLRKFLESAGQERGIIWSGRTDVKLAVSLWQKPDTDPARAPSNYNRDKAVYIVGFQTEEGGLNFLHYWHRRPLGSEDDTELMLDGELPPIVNLGVLW